MWGEGFAKDEKKSLTVSRFGAKNIFDEITATWHTSADTLTSPKKRTIGECSKGQQGTARKRINFSNDDKEMDVAEDSSNHGSESDDARPGEMEAIQNAMGGTNNAVGGTPKAEAPAHNIPLPETDSEDNSSQASSSKDSAMTVDTPNQTTVLGHAPEQTSSGQSTQVATTPASHHTMTSIQKKECGINHNAFLLGWTHPKDAKYKERSGWTTGMV
jgi:hypothetical protein